MRRIALISLVVVGSLFVQAQVTGSVSAGTPAPVPQSSTLPMPTRSPESVPQQSLAMPPGLNTALPPQLSSGQPLPGPIPQWDDLNRPLFLSDHAFCNYIGPISSPYLSKDPRSLTECKFLFINNSFPADNPLFQGGDAQLYSVLVRLALTERLTFLLDKNGVASLSPHGIPHRNGWLNIAAGMKYTFYRDCDRQELMAAGFQYEPPSGTQRVFQGNGSGLVSVFFTAGKQLADNTHLLFNSACQCGVDRKLNSSFIFTQLHIDKQLFGWLYPIAELNWYQYITGGNTQIPSSVGEGDGLMNFGTSGMGGKTLFTGAIGLKGIISKQIEAGFAWETPLGYRRDIINNRLIVEVLLRY